MKGDEQDKLILVSVRIYKGQLERLKATLGIDDSKTIRASMNVAENVILNLFGGEVSNIFRRKKDDEELDLYHKTI